MATPKKPPGYSFSALDLFDHCPWAYKLVRLDRIPRGESEPLIIGATIHRIVADYLNRLILNRLSTDWQWAEEAGNFIDVPADVLEIWERFYQTFVLPPGIEDPGIEKKLAFDRNWQPTEFFSADAYFRAVVDFTFRQGGLVAVVDWKSNYMIYEVEKNLQAKIYGWAVRRAIYPDAQEILLRLHFLRYGAEREILLLPEDLDTVPAELEAKIAVIEAEKHFDPRPGSYCSWCGVQSHCPVMQSALVPVEIMAPATREQAEKAATLLLAVREMDKMITGRLKEYVQANGPVQVGDQIYGPSLSTSYNLDPRGVTEHLLAEGLEVDQVWGMLNLTKTGLERGLKKLKRKDLLDAILAGAPSTQTERIGFAKAK
jgi:hypothetical protein